MIKNSSASHSKLRSGVFILLTVLLLLFFTTTTVSAAGEVVTQGSQTGSLMDMTFNLLGSLLNILYMFSLPILIVAGKAIDNSMIYGEFINLDKPLWMLRNLSRTFANFAVGAVFLWKIFNYIFKSRKGEAPNILKKLLINGALAVIGINISRFGLAALIDLSTIATYSIGALPLGAIQEINKGKDMPILAVSSYFDYQSEASLKNAGTQKVVKPYIYYKWGSINIPQCVVYSKFVIGPEHYPNIPNKPEVNFEGWQVSGTGTQYCALDALNLANITELEQWKQKIFPASIKATTLTNEEKNIMTKSVITNLLSNKYCDSDVQVVGPLRHAGYTGTIAATDLKELGQGLVFADAAHHSFEFCQKEKNAFTVTRNAHDETTWQRGFMSGGIQPYASQESNTINKLINRSQGMVGPFVTLYMTLLNFSNLSSIDQNNISLYNSIGGFTEFFLKTIISIALFIPLIALAVILIIRVVILWIIIAFAPLGIVYASFKEDIEKVTGSLQAKKMPSFLGGGEISIKGIFGLIFAPVIPVFVLSISIIILQAFQMEFSRAITTDNKTWQFLGITSNPSTTNPNETCIDFWGLQEHCYISDSESSSGSGFTNLIPWLFLNIFGIGLMRMMMRLSLKSTGILGGVGENIMNLGKDALSLVPVPGFGVGAGALAKAPQKAMSGVSTLINNKNIEQQNKLFGKFASDDNDALDLGHGVSIKNPDKTKEKLGSNFLAPGTALSTSFDNFSTALTQSNNTVASSAFSTTSSTADKSEIIYNFINTYTEQERKDIDDAPLIKEMLEKKLADIKSEAESSKRKDLEQQFKSYVESHHIPAAKIKSIYSQNADYLAILERILGQTTSSQAHTNQNNNPSSNQTTDNQTNANQSDNNQNNNSPPA